MYDFRLVYERKCPFTLLLRDREMIEKVGRDEIREDEELTVKILLRGPDDKPEIVRIELHSANDYFFMYEHSADFFVYDHMRENQRLKPEFSEYLTILIKLFN